MMAMTTMFVGDGCTDHIMTGHAPHQSLLRTQSHTHKRQTSPIMHALNHPNNGHTRTVSRIGVVGCASRRNFTKGTVRLLTVSAPMLGKQSITNMAASSLVR